MSTSTMVKVIGPDGRVIECPDDKGQMAGSPVSRARRNFWLLSLLAKLRTLDLTSEEKLILREIQKMDTKWRLVNPEDLNP